MVEHVAASPEAGEGSTGEAEASPHIAGENTLRLRTRPRRRRRPPTRPTAAPSGEPGTTASGGSETTPGDEPGTSAQGTTATPPAPRLGPDGQPLRRRRRRRRPPQLGGAGDNAATAQAGDASTAPGVPNTDGNRRPPRRRNRRPRSDRPGAEGAAAPAEQAAGQGRDRRSGPGRGPRDGDRRRERDGRPGRRDRRDGRDGRGRGDGPKRVEVKLYSIDSIVDRGFEDVEEEAGTRRVPWTIVKRTVADQITRKPKSQSYVLQRDGVDSEFPSLGAARDAVHKTIVHPEKLTLSKADHAAQKSNR